MMMSEEHRQTPLVAVMNPLTESAFIRLTKALGRDRGLRYGQDALNELGISELLTAQDLLGFANHLIRHGGIIEAVGRALKVSALLRGASERQSSAPV